MSAMWIPVGSAVAIILLGLGVLEVMSAGVRVDQPATAAWRLWDAPTHSGADVLNAPDDFLPLDFGPTGGRGTDEMVYSGDGDER